MSVESSNARKNQQNDLSDLQAEYAQKKKKYSREQEQELDDLKEFYDGRKEEVRDQGAAAINHIRRKQSESVDSVTEQRKKIAERGDAQLNGIESNYRKKITDTQGRRQEQLDVARRNSQEKLNEIQESQHNKVEKVREDATKEIISVKDRFNRELDHTQTFTQKRLESIKDNNQKTMDHELEKGHTEQAKLENNLKKDYDTTNTHGKKTIAERREIQDKQLQRQDTEYDKRFHKSQEQWDSREKGMNEQYQNRVSHSKKAYETQLKEQHDRFDSLFTKNDSANKESLKIQNNNLLKEQVELKKKFFKSTERYAGKEEDPFYKLQERGNRLRENPDFYIIEAYVPEHEKDSIKVVIKDDTAAISGKRAFTDQIAEEGRKLSTNSYQSFREEFSFDKPVITEGMTRERSGDYVTFWVPKLNSFDPIRKIDKKA